MNKGVQNPLFLILILIGVIIICFLANNNNEKIDEIDNMTNQPVVVNTTQDIIRTPYEINSLDKFYNPMRFPYKSLPNFFNYPNLGLPSQVVGCGARNAPCLGGSQIPIYNAVPPLEVSQTPIAPINIRTRGPRGIPQQVGSISKVFGNQNDIYPLFGRKRWPNDDKWEYYTVLDNGVKIPIVPKPNFYELGENDIVKLKNQPGNYRVTLYEDDFPQYIPYF